MTTEKQAVVEEVKEGATPPAETESAREVPLDELLSQFQTATEKPAVSPTETKTETPKQVEVEPQWAADMKERWLNESIAEVSANVFDGLQVSKRAARAWIEEMARQDPKLGIAFFNRHRNPGVWKSVERALRKEAGNDFPTKEDSGAQADHDAVAAAVRGASTKAPANEPAPRLGGMSQAEFYKYTRENFGF